MTSQGMIAERPEMGRRWLAAALVLAFVGAMAIGLFGFNGTGTRRSQDAVSAPIPGTPRADSPVPVVEPLVLDASKPDEARKLNAAIPFSTDPNPAARPFHFSGDTVARERAVDCLAAAMIYEAGDDPTGERAVGQVVLNRLRHPAFPKTVCGVVFQGQERSTGCQFTFTCDGAMGRAPAVAAWTRARALAGAMLAGDVYAPVGHSTHYHTDWVMPYWSKSLDKVTAVDTHLFFRWKGWWGTPGAFARALAIAAEPVIARLAALSPAHRGEEDPFALTGLPGTLIDDTARPLAIGPEHIGQRIGPGRLVAMDPDGNGFAMTIDKGGDPARYAQAASQLCAGRDQCRLLAWTDPRATPRSFPVAENNLTSMSFSYLRMKDSGIERMLYNCDEFPDTPRIKCMTRRVPIPQAPRLLADDRAGKSNSRLPESARPVADMQSGELAPLPRADARRFLPKGAGTAEPAPAAIGGR
ncbi:SleB-like protein [Sphingobium sp. SYK-6]|uniref:cell wall hydrolase n=1 Tax=Sphingobium sp. (strain NBRC 103272 / SYK-6) TaxID=627192 RepID=UPI0002277435|nr:cell wall hydrolase [Sphingobium sp. SYK-6]BAK66027.1 SleB-like protein [Sphingobium sp. SYK-6]